MSNNSTFGAYMPTISNKDENIETIPVINVTNRKVT